MIFDNSGRLHCRNHIAVEIAENRIISQAINHEILSISSEKKGEHYLTPHLLCKKS